MKVLLTVHQFFPDFAAGTEVLTFSVAKELRARGHEVRVMTGSPTNFELTDQERLDTYEYEGIQVYRFHHAYHPIINQTSKIEIDFDNELAADYFSGLLRVFEPDVIHFFHFSRLGTGLISKALELGVPAFFTPTDFWSICPKGRMSYSDGTACAGPSQDAGNCAMHLAVQPFGALAERLVARIPVGAGDFLLRTACSDAFVTMPFVHEVRAVNRRLPTNIARLNQLHKIVAPNRMLEELLLSYGVQPDKIVQSAYGVDVAQNVSRKPRLNPHDPFRVGFIGTLAPHKGCHILLKAFQSLQQGSAILKVYGAESDFPEYSRELRGSAQGDTSVEFCGTFPNKLISHVLAELDVLVVPSIWAENTPLVVYSAQATGCPVVASDVPGIAGVVHHGIDGLLFKPGSASALSECLARMLSDPLLVGELSANAVKPKSISEYVDDLCCIWHPWIN